MTQPNFYTGVKVLCIRDMNFKSLNPKDPNEKPIPGRIYTCGDIFLDDNNNQWIELREIKNEQLYLWECFNIYIEATKESQAFSDEVLNMIEAGIDDFDYLGI